MYNLARIVLIFLTVGLYLLLRKIFYNRLLEIENDFSGVKQDYARLFQENLQFKRENGVLKKSFEDTLALYDITKGMSKSLETDNVFKYFREEIDRYIKIKDCKFLKRDSDLTSYQNYSLLPLEINKALIGYLAADGIKDEDKVKFQILAQQFLLGIKRSILYQEVQELVITDSLTGIPNRRYYRERLDEELERSKKFNFNFCCLMIDIDHFKSYNDRYGHLVGDAVLMEVSRRIKENIRQVDFMGRYGGEEFSVILSETDRDSALFVAERILKAVKEEDIVVYDERLQLTISIGISAFPLDGRDAQAIIDSADSALYCAKEMGRDRVCVFQAK